MEISNNKPFPLLPKGDQVSIFRTNEKHYGKTDLAHSPDHVAESFASAMSKALESVNDQQVVADELTQKMIFDPSSVDTHEVMIAAEKARMSLTFTKTLADGFVKAYRELTSLR